jgi:hypothetical protein
MLLTLFGNRIGHWKYQLVGSFSLLVLWGSLLAMVTPFNKTQMIAFATLGQMCYGWAAYLSVTYVSSLPVTCILSLSYGCKDIIMAESKLRPVT